MSKKLSIAALALALAGASVPSWGAASGSVVYDPTNWAQNSTTAANSIRQTQYQYQQLLTQYQQYLNMVKQAKSMQGLAGVALGQDGFGSIQNVNQALAAYRNLGNSVQQTQNIYSQRLDEAKLMGVSWSKYMSVEQQRIAANKEGAAARVQSEMQAFQRVEDDYRFARETADKIPMTDGMHAAQQQTNAILNRMVTQNADIMRTLAQANGSQKAEEMIQKSEAEAAKAAANQRLIDAQRNVSIDPATAVDAMMNAAKR